LAIAFAYRAPQLNAPILGEHAWRQADTASIARNFTENGYRILHPQIDWGGRTSGEVESEFPLYPFLVAVLNGAFCESEIWARGLSLLFSLATIVFLYLLVRDFVDRETALWSSAFFAILPLCALFGRAVMPEPLMLMASVSGVYFFSRWTRTRGHWDFVASAALVSTACLVKLPCLYLGAPLLFLAWHCLGTRALREPWLWLYALIVLVPVVLWYWHAHQIFQETGLSFGIWGYGTDKWGNWDLVSSGEYWNRVLFNRLAHRHLTWFGFAIFLTGLFLRRKQREERLFDVWLAGLGVYLVVVGVGNYVHNYYQLPLLIPATVFMGKVYARFFRAPILRSPASLALAGALAAIAILSAARLHEFRAEENPETSSVFQLAEELRRVSDPSEKIISVSLDPTLFYLAHRKGWKASLASLREEDVAVLIEQGARYVAGTRSDQGWSGEEARRFADLRRAFSVSVDTDRYYIIKLSSAK
jgi:4-amino-4-deoxy-L-arabinose transferase-like glycosyltransferase